MYKTVVYLFVSFFTLLFQTANGQDFVSIKGRNFEYKGKPYYLLSTDLTVGYNSFGNDTVLCLHSSYCSRSCGDLSTAEGKLMEDLKLLWDNGFNSIRLDGLQVIPDQSESKLLNKSKTALFYPFNNQINRIRYFLDLLERTVPEMKVILLAGDSHIDVVADEYNLYLGQLAKSLKDYTNLVAYDLLNEPEYGGAKDKSPATGSRLTKQWYETLHLADPNHLVTIGVAGIDCLYSWDPSVLAIDFPSYHIYLNPDQPLSLLDMRLKWCSRAVKEKPWILGEAGLAAADSQAYSWVNTCKDDIGTEQEQLDFVNRLFYTCDRFNCSGIQYWHHREVAWFEAKYGNPCRGSGALSANHYGLIYHPRSTYKPNEPKLAWFAFKEFALNNYKPVTISMDLQVAGEDAKRSILTTISNQANQPIDNALITYSGIDNDGNALVVKNLMTDLNGQLELDFNKFKKVQSIKVAAPGYLGKNQKLKKRQAKGRNAKVNLILEPYPFL